MHLRADIERQGYTFTGTTHKALYEGHTQKAAQKSSVTCHKALYEGHTQKDAQKSSVICPVLVSEGCMVTCYHSSHFRYTILQSWPNS